MEIRPIVVTPTYRPPETYQGHLKRVIDPLLDNYSHILLVDRDMIVPKEFNDLPFEHPDAEIITVHVRSMSRVFALWERLTYGVRLGPRMRGSAVVYSTMFLKRVGGYPLKTSPDTWLLQHSPKVVQADVIAWHGQPFSLAHAVRKQLQDGESRVELGYPVWKTVLHSVFRLRPLVLPSYLYYRGRLARQRVGRPSQ